MTVADAVTRQVDGFLARVADEEHVTAEGLDVRALVAHRVRKGLIDPVVITSDEDCLRSRSEPERRAA